MASGNKRKVRIEFDMEKAAEVVILLKVRGIGDATYGAVNMGVNSEKLRRTSAYNAFWAPLPYLTADKFEYIRVGSYPVKKGKNYIVVQPRISVDIKELCIVKDDVRVTEFR